MAIDIKSYNEILGEMIRKIIADSPLNDINTGSVLLTLLEAAAQVDFENNASVLSILELLSIDATRNNDLDSRAGDLGLSRTPARKATGLITIKDSNITKISTGLYQVKPAPIAGTTTLFVNDATAWTPTGNLFIGRGTQSFEGPIPYTAVVNNVSFWTITLGAALQKDHLISDIVVDAQGTTDRFITAGTTVQIPANNQNPTVEFRTLRNAVLPAGEDTVAGIDIIASLAGSKSNAGINTITSFVSPPFVGATVTNTVALTNGSDIESDNALRERLKSYANTLARGTTQAILSAVIGVYDPTDSKQVTSAKITEPPKIGELSTLYIDDSNGFQPSFAGQSVDKLLSNATGSEEFLQLANFPLPRPQSINTKDGPYELVDGMEFRVVVDGVEETLIFNTKQFLNIAAARISEVIIAINDQSTSFKATFTDNSARILLFPVSSSAEIIQVSPLRATDSPTLFANNILKFPTNEYSYIHLYQNNTLLHERTKAATLLTAPFSAWGIIAPGNLVLSVDGTPPQDQSFSSSDFLGAPLAALSLTDWVTVFNTKYAGITATATSSGRMQLVSNKEGTSSLLDILGGTFLGKLFSDVPVSAIGQNPDFELNRQTGNLRILTDILPGDSISAGVEDAKGAVFSSITPTGTYNVSTDLNGRDAEAVVVADSKDVVPRINLGLSAGDVITITDQGSSVMRLKSNSITSFVVIQPDDYLYITSRGIGGWIDPANTGLFRVITKGEHTVANSDTYIEVKNLTIVPSVSTVLDAEDIQAFKANTYPQLWKGSFTAVPAAAPIQNVVDSFNDNIVNTKSSIFKTDSVKITSTTEENGTIAIPVSVGKAALLFASHGSEQHGNPPHVANRTSDTDLVSHFKRTEPTNANAEGVSGKKVWLDRVQYTDIHGALTSGASPGVEGTDTYSEVLQSTGKLDPTDVSYDDVYNATSGANKLQYRSIRDKLPGDTIGTQFELPRTLMDYISLDTFNLMRPVGINAEDSVIIIMDQDATAKTIDIPMARKGIVNTNFPATNLSFSADDADNEPGINFGNLQVWGKTANHTEFENYAVWMRARNWYVTGGAGSGGGGFIIRSKEWGPTGENFNFSIDYPSSANQANSIAYINRPDGTDATYYFGSGPLKPIGIVGGDQFTVTSLGSDVYRMTFITGAISLATVVVGDIISILSDSGVNVANAGQYRISAVNIPGKTLDIHNINGAVTGVGSPEITPITTVADVVGSQTVSTITTNAIDGTIADNRFFKINDSAGVVAVVYDKNSSVGTPASYGAYRIIVVTLTGTESNATLTALTAGVIDADPLFSASYVGNIITVTNTEYGNSAAATDGSPATGFSFGGTTGIAASGMDGKYFTLYDVGGSVAFWYDTTGITPEPLHGALRSVRISTVNSGDSANTIATKTAVVVNGDAGFSATALGATITITDAANGPRTNANSGTSGFTVGAITDGVATVAETVITPTSFTIYSPLNTTVSDIVAKVSSNVLMDASTISSATPIVKATRDEVYTPAGPGDYSLSLSYGHDPNSLNNNYSKIKLYDGINWTKEFENTNPNFTLKTPLTLQGVAPSAYSIVTATNPGSATLGEYFKLVPVTLNNVYHQFTQKALSQLPIVAGVDISNNIRRVQIKSKLLGSAGAVEVIGGNANNVHYSIFGEGQVAPGISKNFLEVKTAAYPVSLAKGDIVQIENQIPAKRTSRLVGTDTVDVFKSTANNADYRYNAKVTGFTSATTLAITDVSALYGRAGTGTIWRWTHNGTTAALLNVHVGDLLNAYGIFSGSWNSGNKVKAAGDNRIAGYPIVFVNASAKYVDIVNPDGVAMGATAIGATASVEFTPTPLIEWNLKHAATVQVTQVILSAPFGTATVTTVDQHKLREGDTFTLSDNGIAQTAVVIAIANATTFTFTDTTGLPAQTYILGSVIRSSRVPTRYKIETLGFNNLFRLSWVDGDAPGFVDCGAAVDDVLIISGSTFISSNVGNFRILGVDNTSIVYKNESGVEELNTLVPFNNLNTKVTWTTNSTEVVGTAGSFKNVNIGDWVKKPEDNESKFIQVIALLNTLNVPVSAVNATKIILGSVYKGSTANSLGLTYDQNSNVGKGNTLQDMYDVRILEGDSVFSGDSLFVDKNADPSWFGTVNSGLFEIIQVGTDGTDNRPFIRITNASGIDQSTRDISVSPLGFFVIESDKVKYASLRVVEHTAIDSVNPDRRVVYMTPSTKVDKISQSYGTRVVAIGKLNYSTDVTTGVDGYTYYTGLLRTVQRVVDGFEPDAISYPGRRAVGAGIETLGPLIKKIQVSMDVTTNEGVNLNDIANDIRTAIINYIDDLGVGDDVILSEMIVRVMGITGVVAVTFNIPTPSTERISVSDHEKAYIETTDISIA